ncbi:hypothetical protein D9611_013296 [Ephemerocybe angulata]|uniref:Transmembrane protein n=1 Tax=Ephemerocybe angulata TaxID=980116 RepID=A0A8H5FIK4_9AGAR|nr:hypothetical protein D9611_013296 [Tulosesus angulatus]
MATTVQFYVNDTSPAISYTPFADTLSTPNTGAGWNPYYTGSGYATAQGVKGQGTSFHITSLEGASLTIAWIGESCVSGSGIQLHGNVTNASYTISLDGTNVADPAANLPQNVLATLTDLPERLHTVTLTARFPDSKPDTASVAFGRAIVASNPPNVNSSDPSTEVAFLGRWSFASDGATNFHESDFLGDQATARFRGAAFTLQGTTSPESGNYSVTVDNQTVSYSGRSSFLSRDALLHYSTGLDPNVTHTVVVTNEGGGKLALAEGGFGDSPLADHDAPPQYASPTNHPPTPVGSSSSYPKGTIAAFALAGVLAFCLFSGCLYFFFIYRPRKKYQLERERWRASESAFYGPKAQEAGDIIEIGQNPPLQPEQDIVIVQGQSPSSQRPSKNGKRNSEKSSFLKWKREVEQGRARDSLGIQFRHSDIYDEKSNDPRTLQYDNNSTILSSSERTGSRTPSFLRPAKFMRTLGIAPGSKESSYGRSKGKQKGKESRRVSDNRSWSPSYDINLPFQHPSHEEMALPRPPQAPTPGSMSLSYMTAPVDPEATGEPHLAPPSYAASISHRSGDSPPSVPRSVTQSFSIPTALPSSHIRKSRALEKEKSPVTSYTSSLTPPYPVRDLSKEDRGSLMDQSIDETPTLLSGTAVRQLIRSLSPRTSKASFPRHRPTMSMELGSLPPDSPRFQRRQSHSHTLGDLPEQPSASRVVAVPPSLTRPSPTRSDFSDRYTGQSEPTSPVTDEALAVPHSGGLPRSSGTFGPPRSSLLGQSSWIAHEDPPPLPEPNTPSSSSHFQQGPGSRWSSSPSPPQPRPSTSQGTYSNRVSALPPARSGSSQSTSRFPLQITPATPIPTFTPPFAESDTGMRNSFLDMSQSSDVSAYSQSKENTDSSSLNNDTRRYSTPQGPGLGLPEERSRWSSTNSAPMSTNPAEHGHDSDGNNNGSGDNSGSGNDSSPKSKGSNGVTPPQIMIPPASQFLSPHQHARFSVSGSSTRSDPVHVHPPLEYMESPTDSFDVSSGDVDFRHSDSDGISHGHAAGMDPRTRRIITEGGGLASVRTSASSSLYPFPSIPTFHTPEGGPSATRVSPEADTASSNPPPTPPPVVGLSSPNYIAERVLGLHSPSSSVTARPPVTHSRTGSASAFSTTPFGSTRFASNATSQLRHATTSVTSLFTRTSESPKPPRDPTP